MLGENLVGSWLAEGFVSLAASRLESLPSGNELRAAAERAYDHLTFSERTEKVNELLAFVQKVSEGDLVVTTTGGQLFVGDAAGATTFTPTGDGRANVRRPVQWRNADTPLDYADHPASVAAKFQGGGTLVELTAQLAGLEAMLTDVGGEDAETEQPALVAHRALARLAPGSVDDLHVTDEWASLVVDLLNERTSPCGWPS